MGRPFTLFLTNHDTDLDSSTRLALRGVGCCYVFQNLAKGNLILDFSDKATVEKTIVNVERLLPGVVLDRVEVDED